MERKEIAKVEPRWNDHVLLIFTDNTQQMIQRQEHQGIHSHQEANANTPKTLTTVHHLKPGDMWPPLPEVHSESYGEMQARVERERLMRPSADDLDKVAEESNIADETNA